MYFRVPIIFSVYVFLCIYIYIFIFLGIFRVFLCINVKAYFVLSEIIILKLVIYVTYEDKKFGSKKLRTNNGGVLDTNLIFKKREKSKINTKFCIKKCIILYNNTPKK